MGEGGLFQRADGLWVAQIRTGGKIVRRYAKTKPLAKSRLEELQLTAGRVDRKTTVGAYLRAWLDGPGRKVLKASTWTTYDVAVRLHIAPAIGGHALSRLTPEHIEAMVADLDLTSKGIRNVLSVLSRILAVAERRRAIVANPVRFVEPPRSAESEERLALTPDDARRIRAAVAGDRLEALYILALATGLRMAELLGLAWSDVDLDNATLRVGASLARENGKYVLTDPKTRRSRRTVALPPFAIDALRAHRTRQLAERLAAGVPTDDGLVFVSPVGRAINGGWLSHHWRKLSRAAGLDVSFHGLRHGQSSLLIALGVHPRVVQERMGHATVAMSMDRYGHVATAQDREAADRLQAAIG